MKEYHLLLQEQKELEKEYLGSFFFNNYRDSIMKVEQVCVDVVGEVIWFKIRQYTWNEFYDELMSNDTQKPTSYNDEEIEASDFIEQVKEGAYIITTDKKKKALRALIKKAISLLKNLQL